MPDTPRDRFLKTRLSIDESAFVAPGAIVVGDVEIGAHASVWYQAVLRGDLEPIRLGARSNVQDGAVVHVDRGHPAIIGEDVTIGHRAVVHGAVLEPESLVGMGAVVLTGARVGRGALVAAGAVVLEGFDVPDGMLAAGIPARVICKVDDGIAARVKSGREEYVESAAGYLSGRLGGGPRGGS